MHSETSQLAAYFFFYLIGGCFAYLLLRFSPNLSHEASKVPAMFLAMASANFIATALNLILFASVSFNFGQLQFVGPFAYTASTHRQPALLLHFLTAVVAFWFGLRWLQSRCGELPSKR
jgi:hypothetical protein